MDATIEELKAESAELAKAAASRWEPLCVARQFARSEEPEFCFTMQGWVDLEAVRSPLLEGLLPQEDVAEHLAAALAAFGLPRVAAGNMEPAAAVEMLQAMRDEIIAGFAMAVKMSPIPGTPAPRKALHGMGQWLPVYACLVTQCRLSPDEALNLRVGRAFALISGMRINEGRDPEGASYAERDALAEVGDRRSEVGDQEAES